MEFVLLADRQDTIPTIAEWYFKEWGYLRDISSVEKTETLLQDYLNREEIPLLILAVDGEEVLGVVQLKCYEMDLYPEKEHWLGGVYVPPKYRGKKVAENLVKKAVETARSHQVQNLFLQTRRIDGGLYKRLGWKPVEKMVYRGEEILIMKKQLLL